MNENEKKERLEVKSMIDSITTYTIPELVREDLGPELNFVSATKLIESYLTLFKNIASCDFDEIPIQQIRTMSSQGAQAIDVLNSLRDFSLIKHPNNPIATRDQLLRNVQDYYSLAIDEIAYIADYFKPRNF